MSLTVASKIRLGFIFGLLVLLLGGAMTLYSTTRGIRTAAAVRHSNQVLERLERTRTLVVDAETGARGFALSGREDFLNPYSTAREQIPEALRTLRSLTADSPDQQQRLNELEPLIRDRLALLQDCIEARRTRGLKAAAAEIAAGEGRAATDRIRRLLDAMNREEAQLLVVRTMADEAASRRILIAETSLVLLAVSLVVLTFLLLDRLITGPVGRLMAGVARLAGGDLRARVANHRQDEFGNLARAFNDMAERRQRAEVNLTEAKGLLDGLFEAAPVAIVALDLVGNVEVWNPAAEALFGYSASEVLGRPLQIIPESQSRNFEDLRRRIVEKHEVLRVDGRRRRRDGTLFDSRSLMAPRIRGGVPYGLMTLEVDVTEEKRAAEALRSSEQRLAHELEVATQLHGISTRFMRDGDLYAVLDEVVRTAIGITHADLGNLQLFESATQRLRIVAQRGFSRQWLEYFDSVEEGTLVCGTALGRGERVIVEDVASSPIFSDEARHVQLQDGVRAVQSTPLIGRSGLRVGMLSTHFREPPRLADRDLALLDLLASQTAEMIERSQAELRLQESEVRLKRAQQLAHLGSWELEPRTDQFTCSDELYRIFGLAPQELRVTYETLLDAVHPEDRAGVDAALTSALCEGRDTCELEYRIVQRSTGEVRFVHERCEHFRDDSGHLARSVGTIQDITERKRVEQSLKESEERFRLTMDEAPIGMALVGLDGRFVRVNNVLCEIVGYPAEELMRLSFQAITHPDDLDADVTLAGKLTRGEFPRYQLEKRYIRKDGRIVHALLNVSVLRDRKGAAQYFISQIEDITERKRAEEALRLSEAKFSGIISISEDAIISIDEQQRITLFNHGAEKIFGYSREEALGARLDLLLPTRFHARHGQALAGFATGDVPAKRMGERAAEILGRRKNGEEFPAEASISQLEVGGQRLLTVALRDVTERRRYELEQRLLAEVGASLTTSLDYRETIASVARLVVREVAELCVIDVANEQGELERLAVAHSDPAKVGACQQLANLPLDRKRPHLASSAVETGRPILWTEAPVEILSRLAQTPERLKVLRELNPQSGVAVPLWARGRVQGLLFFACSSPNRYGARDQALAEELARRIALALENARLYQSAKLATQARDDVLGIVAHDLRNPLSSIGLATSVLEHQLSEDGTQRGLKSIETIRRSLRRSQRLIADLLDVTRMEAGQLSVKHQRVRTLQLVYDVLETQQLLASSASIELQLEMGGELPELQGDHDRLLQVMENLIGNAVKFTPAGGRVTVGAERHDGEVLFRVTDTGAGIPPEHLPRLFDRFWRAKRDERSGAGLGLPICKGIVEAHGGRIWAESAVGHGTTFYFTVPTWPGKSVQADHGQASSP